MAIHQSSIYNSLVLSSLLFTNDNQAWSCHHNIIIWIMLNQHYCSSLITLIAFQRLITIVHLVHLVIVHLVNLWMESGGCVVSYNVNYSLWGHMTSTFLFNLPTRCTSWACTSCDSTCRHDSVPPVVSDLSTYLEYNQAKLVIRIHKLLK